VAAFFAERLASPVGLDVWTRRHTGIDLPDQDPCEYCPEQLALMRQFARVSPLLTITSYDLQRHAKRAAEVGVDMAPTTIIRSAGRSLQFVGMADGLLLPAFMDVMSYFSLEATPLADESLQVLSAIEAPLDIELIVAPYDGYSAHMMRLTAALAVESRHVRLRIVDATAYPIFAAKHGVTSVPVLTIAGRRFDGVWIEPELLRQVKRIVAGNTEPVHRTQPASAPFVTEVEARRMAAEAPESNPPAPGLYIPGRD